MKLKALLVDDEFPARKELRFLLQPFENIQIVGEATNALEALELINSLDYSVVFLDIDMPGLNGIQLAKELSEKPDAPCIIFITAHEEFAFEAFSVNAIDYILKPIHPKRLEQALAKIISRKGHQISGQTIGQTNGHLNGHTNEQAHGQALPADGETPAPRPMEVIPVEQRGKTILLRPEEIVYIYTDKDNVFVKTQKDSYLTRFTLRELESRLSTAQFFRSHRCYLVNIKRMRELIPYFNGTYSVVVDDHERSEIPVSRTQSRKLKEILGI
ncbi:MAG: LytTR family transcriptional regulator DNA-binding domain-containing protein [Desulfitobacterium hafniense]|nr:LytTR family transcriptional regulator DNA-binding domain-containing protein [Desulfitobacterium hafniense]